MAENKKLSDDNLNLVSGGTAHETSQDSVFLNDLLVGKPSQPQKHGDYWMRMYGRTDEIKAAWASVGVDATLFTGNLKEEGEANIYKIGGKVVSRDAAIAHAKKVVGYHDPLDWGTWD